MEQRRSRADEEVSEGARASAGGVRKEASVRVLRSLPFSGAGYEFTTLVLDSEVPGGMWTKIAAEGSEYETVYLSAVYISGPRLDTVAIKGAHDLTGMEVEFV